MVKYTWQKSKIDLEQLRLEIRKMTPPSKLFKLLREELIKLDHWKQKARGNPVKGYLSRGKNKEGNFRNENNRINQ